MAMDCEASLAKPALERRGIRERGGARMTGEPRLQALAIRGCDSRLARPARILAVGPGGLGLGAVLRLARPGRVGLGAVPRLTGPGRVGLGAVLRVSGGARPALPVPVEVGLERVDEIADQPQVADARGCRLACHR